jgi:hypothetical protein
MNTILEKHQMVGKTRAQVVDSWGQPAEITYHRANNEEDWLYGKDIRIRFRNGVLIKYGR